MATEKLGEVWIVEDQRQFSDMYSLILRQPKIHTRTFSSAAEAQVAFNKLENGEGVPPVVLVLDEILQPGEISGNDLLREILLSKLSIPFIVCLSATNRPSEWPEKAKVIKALYQQASRTPTMVNDEAQVEKVAGQEASRPDYVMVADKAEYVYVMQLVAAVVRKLAS